MDFHDLVSSTTHLLTAIWAAFATWMLVRLTRGHGVGRWAIGCFGLSMVLLYSASALFHGLHYSSASERSLFQKLDKSAVFLLIAGSYVPIVVYLLNGRWRRWTFAAVAGTALFGIGSLWLAPGLPYEALIAIYAAMGLSGLLPLRQYAAVAGWANFKWVYRIVGPYLGGGIVEAVQRPVLWPGWFGPHELMHVAAMVGSVAYFAFTIKVLIRRPPLAEDSSPQPVADTCPASVVESSGSGFVPLEM